MTRVRSPRSTDQQPPNVDAVWRVSTRSASETRALGQTVGRVAEPGAVVLLSGDLGAGKTVFAQGVGAGLGTPGVVNSPTFVLLNEHLGGRLPLLHADLYRLTEASEVEELALHEVALDGVLLVEWPERAEGQLPDDRITVEIAAGEDIDGRVLRWTARGACAVELLRRVRAEGG